MKKRIPTIIANAARQERERRLFGNAFCPTGEGGGVDPSCSPKGNDRPPDRKPTLNEFQEWTDKGWSWGEKGWEPPVKAAPVSSAISDEEHAQSARSVNDREKGLAQSSHEWESKKPWDMSLEDVQQGNAPGFATGKFHSKTEAAHYDSETGTIYLAPSFFAIKDSESRRHIVYYELGHQMADTMSKDGTIFRLTDAGVFPRHHGMGSGDTPEEFVADAFATLHTDHKWLKDRHADAINPIISRARALGLPIPGSVRNENSNTILLPSASPHGGRKHTVSSIRQGWTDPKPTSRTNKPSSGIVGQVHNLARPTSKRTGKRLLSRDPSRTLTLRRSMAKIIRRKFARLKLEIVRLVAAEDAFGLKARKIVQGLAENAFCPTGEGGGVDPSCSPGAVKIGSVSARFNSDGSTRVEQQGSKRVITYTKDGVRMGYTTDMDGRNVNGFVVRSLKSDKEEVVESPPPPTQERSLRELEAQGRAEREKKVSDFERKVGFKVLHPQDAIHALKEAGIPVFKPARPRANDPGRDGADVNAHQKMKTALIVQFRGRGGDVDYASKSKEMEKALVAVGYTVERNLNGDPNMLYIRRPVTNAFCPTGEGGGVDPSCSSGGGHAGKATAKFTEIVNNPPAVKPSDRMIKEMLRDGATPEEIAAGFDSDEGRIYIDRYDMFPGLAKVRDRLTSLAESMSDENSKIGDEHYEDYASEAEQQIYPRDRLAELLLSVARELKQNRRLTRNAFCPTGEGGGIDPTCSPNGSSAHALKLDLGHMNNTEKRAVETAISKAMTVGDKKLRINKIEVGESPYSAHYSGFGKGEIIIGKDTVEYARDFDKIVSGREKTQKEFGTVNTVKELGDSPEEVLALEVAHELGHHVEQVLFLDLAKAHREVVDAGHDLSEPVIQRLSGYATVNIQERFAETHALMSLGKENLVPPEVRRWYLAALKTADPEGMKKYVITNSGQDTLNHHQEDTLKNLLSLSFQKSTLDHPRSLEQRKLTEGRGTPSDVVGNTTSSRVANDRWRFNTSPQKLEEFQRWLRQQFGKELVGQSDEALWERYIQEGWRKGAGRAFDDVQSRKGKRGKGKTKDEQLGFYKGTREEFLRSSFGRPENVDKVKLLASRTFDDLENVTADMGARMSRTLADGLVEGKHPTAIARDLVEDLDLGEARANLIAQTEIMRAHNESQLTALEDMGMDEVGVAVEWEVTEDNVLCPKCEAMRGVVLKIEEARGLLPAHPNCLPGDSLVLSRSGVAAASKRWFDGNLVIIRTASGRELSCTPNHPVLTEGGRWTPAHLLDVGSRVVCDGGSEWRVGGNDNSENIPTCIHDVAESVRRSGKMFAREVPVSAPDFHGDGGGSDVANIWADGTLGGELDPTSTEHLADVDFVLRSERHVPLSGLGSGTKLLEGSFAPGNCGMCGGDLVGTLLVGHPGPLEGFGLALIPALDTGRNKYASDHVSGEPELFGDDVFALPGKVEGNDFVREPIIELAPGHVGVTEQRSDYAVLDAELGRKIASGAPCEVFLDDVVSVRQVVYSGHVYNLQTGEGWYSAQGIITHNCRCVFLPANVDEIEKGQKRSKSDIEDAAEEAGIELSVGKDRPRGIF